MFNAKLPAYVPHTREAVGIGDDGPQQHQQSPCHNLVFSVGILHGHHVRYISWCRLSTRLPSIMAGWMDGSVGDRPGLRATTLLARRSDQQWLHG